MYIYKKGVDSCDFLFALLYNKAPLKRSPFKKHPNESKFFSSGFLVVSPESEFILLGSKFFSFSVETGEATPVLTVSSAFLQKDLQREHFFFPLKVDPLQKERISKSQKLSPL